MHPPLPPSASSLRQWVLLAEYERLRTEWRHLSAAADEVDGCLASDAHGLQDLLHLRLLADRLQRAALKLLRDAPI